MAHVSHSETHDEGSPEDYAADHPQEHPEDWGWHADFGPIARVAGWVCVVILLLMITTTHYNGAGTFALVATAALLVLGLLWDIHRRKTAWRN